MNRFSLRLFLGMLGLGLGLGACAADEPDAPVVPDDAPLACWARHVPLACDPGEGETRRYLLRDVALERGGEQPGLAGVDLDCARGDTAGTCMQPDEPGAVDNRLGALFAFADPDRALRDEMRAGRSLLGVEIEGAASLEDDACVRVRLVTLALDAPFERPILEADGRISRATPVHSTFVLAETDHARIEGGRLVAWIDEVALDVPTVAGESITVPLTGVVLDAHVDERGLTGAIGGSTDVLVMSESVADGDAEVLSSMRDALGTLADGAPDATGACTTVSFGLGIGGVTSR
jgi:hypothetical protein